MLAVPRILFGQGQGRSWDDVRRNGYISAGGGAWYTRTLQLLSPGDRVWVHILRTATWAWASSKSRCGLPVL